MSDRSDRIREFIQRLSVVMDTAQRRGVKLTVPQALKLIDLDENELGRVLDLTIEVGRIAGEEYGLKLTYAQVGQVLDAVEPSTSTLYDEDRF